MAFKVQIRHLLSRRKYQNAFKLLFLFGFILLLYHGYIYTTEQLFFHWNYLVVLEANPYIDTNKLNCVLPRLDPWDEHAKPYFFHVPPITCQKVQPFLTEVTKDGALQWNKTEIEVMNLKTLIPQLKCNYQEIVKNLEDDDRPDLLELNVFTGYAVLTHSFANISCYKDGSLYYHNIHAWMPKSIYQKFTPTTSLPSIQIFILDAVSQPNFIRQLPSTYKVLTEEMSSIMLNGLIKVGINTFPNVGAMLTGGDVHGTSLPSHNGSFDDWPIIWKNLSRAGYVTIFGEDVPEYNTFNYLDTGFKRQPTDIYMRPFWLTIEDPNGPLFGQSSENCYGNLPQHLIMIDFLKRCTETLKNYPFFMITNMMQFSHNELNMLQTLDKDLTDFFRWFHKTSKNTILIVMGDHGINFGEFRSTQLGRVESAFPYFSISLPENIKRLYPHLEENLRINKHRMSSWYDIYDTLMDVVTIRYDKPRHQWSKNGFSLFYPLPTHRTCKNAGIPSQYCPCEIEITLATNSSDDIKMAAKTLVDIVNKELSVEPRCPPLELLTVKSAIKILPNGSTAKAKGFVNIYRIVIELLPSHALLEARMKNDAWAKDFTVDGSIIRLDKFGNSTNCVEDKYLRNFCYCDKV